MKHDAKTLIKVLIGVAWLDGKPQPEARQYLRRIAQETGVNDDREIQLLLHDLRPAKREDCYEWLQTYLGDRPTSEACHQLIEAISDIIYCDGMVSIEEARLLTRLQLLEAQSNRSPSRLSRLLITIRKIYHHWASQI